MRITVANDFSNLKTDEDFRRYTSIWIKEANSTINGSLTFPDNFIQFTVTVGFTLANKDVAITHNLNRVPSGYLLLSSTTALSLYDGSNANTATTLYLRSSAIGTAKVMVLG